MRLYGVVMTYYEPFQACHIRSRKVDDSLEASLDVKTATCLERVEVGAECCDHMLRPPTLCGSMPMMA